MSETAPAKSVKTGAIALVFLIIGFEAALFVHRAAVTALVAHRDEPDTVFVYAAPPGSQPPPWLQSGSPQEVQSEPGETELAGASVAGLSPANTERHNAQHSAPAVRVRENYSPRRVESFRFDPNTASLDDFMRLGFSEKQGQAIINYREKGGRFRRPSDFANSYVVADSVFERLRPFIDIPKVDINRADSAALTSLPGIGPYFAGKIVQYRSSLGGFSFKEQLLEIYHFDQEKYDGLSDLISCSRPSPYPLWSIPEEELRRHPYIKGSAHGIVLYRTHNPADALTLDGLLDAGVISANQHSRLSRIVIASPDVGNR